MSNALGTENPPPPEVNSGNALQQGGGAPAAPNATPAAPDHAQTVAALRHFDAIRGELETLLKDSSVGKADLKSKAIDGITQLVSKRFMSPADAVMQLSQFPTDPADQAKWLQSKWLQTKQAESAILDHHRNTNLGSGDWATEAQQHNTNPDNHMQDMAALQANYGGGK